MYMKNNSTEIGPLQAMTLEHNRGEQSLRSAPVGEGSKSSRRVIHRCYNRGNHINEACSLLSIVSCQCSASASVSSPSTHTKLWSRLRPAEPATLTSNSTQKSLPRQPRPSIHQQCPTTHNPQESESARVSDLFPITTASTQSQVPKCLPSQGFKKAPKILQLDSA
jgi:hypothetical protein